jgi:opacity protein-like surface antigen
VSGAWQQRETVHEVDDSQTFIKFHSGFLANAALGIRFDSFRFELETSFMNNEVDLAGAGGLSSPSPGNVNIRAYMFNVYHDVQFKDCCWKPYVGAGIGTYQSEINGLIPEFFDQIGPPFAGVPVNATSDMPLAYQFRAGVTRPVGCRSEFFTGYRYFKGEELEFASAPFATFAPTFHPDGAEIHAVELGVRVNF